MNDSVLSVNSALKTASSESISIKYLRALATIFIVVCHYMQTCDSKWGSVFNIGVQLFFVISGYLFGSKKIGDWGGVVL